MADAQGQHNIGELTKKGMAKVNMKFNLKKYMTGRSEEAMK